MTYDISSPSEMIVLRLDSLDKDGKILVSAFKSIEVKNLKKFIKNMGATEVVYRKYTTEGGSEDVYIKHENMEVSTLESDLYNLSISTVLAPNAHNSSPIKTFMHLFFLVPPVGGFYDALASPLTAIGGEQLRILTEYIEAIREICKSQTVYAPFTSLIQSSGFGKTKICLELLKKSPGAYIVFRRPTDTGVPAMSSWMEIFKSFILSAPSDAFPGEIKYTNGDQLLQTTIGRFLLAIYFVMKEYVDLYLKLFGAFHNKYQVAGLTVDEDTINEIVFRIIGSQFMKKPSFNSSLFNPKFDTSEMGITSEIEVISKLSELLASFKGKFGPDKRKGNSIPFLLFFDELEVMTVDIKPGRSSAVHIVRRGLHLLNNNTNILGIAIGTNSDALDFSPTIRDNSCRIPGRTNLLSPLPLSGSFDLLKDKVKYGRVYLTCDDLRNRALFNVLVSFGRALWSSCSLSSVVEIAVTKIKNGDQSCMGSRIALLLMRADLSVNTHHVLARNLIRSYMSIVGYISTDVQDIKIGYSSEPVLAMAARKLLKSHAVRSDSLHSLKEFLERGAIDKGRIVETLFEYITLFAIDDAESSIESYDSPESVPREFSKLANCRSHILEIVEEPAVIDAIEQEVLFEFESKNSGGEAVAQITTPMSQLLVDPSSRYAKVDYVDIKKTFYSVKTVKDYLKGLLGTEQRYKSVAKMIDSQLLEGIVNCSHFLQLEKLQLGDFSGLTNVPSVETMKKSIIDKALLTYGIQRQCGFVMPPNYFGIDFIVPFAFKSTDNTRTIYSFIAIQSKSTKINIYECAAKMCINLHYCVCVNDEHDHKEVDCYPEANSSECGTLNNISCTKLKDFREICENQISILLVAEENNPKSFQSRLSIALSKFEVPAEQNEGTSDSTDQPMEIELSGKRIYESVEPGLLKTSKPVTVPSHLFMAHLTNASDTEINPNDPSSLFPFDIEAYPAIFKNNYLAQPAPDAIITKTADPNLSVVQFLWDYTVNSNNDVASNDFVPPEKRTGKAGKRQKTAKPSVDDVAMKGLDNLEAIKESEGISIVTLPTNRRVGTCIVCSGMSSFAHLFDSNGVKLLKCILDFEKSSFHNVDKLHLPIVQNALINGKACPYYQVNPILCSMRNMPVISDPTIGYKSHYSLKSWEESISRCIVGPVDSTVPSGNIVYNEKDPFELGFYENDSK